MNEIVARLKGAGIFMSTKLTFGIPVHQGDLVRATTNVSLFNYKGVAR